MLSKEEIKYHKEIRDDFMKELDTAILENRFRIRAQLMAISFTTLLNQASKDRESSLKELNEGIRKKAKEVVISIIKNYL